jgi:hypothetical protein
VSLAGSSFPSARSRGTTIAPTLQAQPEHRKTLHTAVRCAGCDKNLWEPPAINPRDRWPSGFSSCYCRVHLVAQELCRGSVGSRDVDDELSLDSPDFTAPVRTRNTTTTHANRSKNPAAPVISSHGSSNCTAMTAAINPSVTTIHDHQDTIPLQSIRPAAAATQQRYEGRGTRRMAPRATMLILPITPRDPPGLPLAPCGPAGDHSDHRDDVLRFRRSSRRTSLKQSWLRLAAQVRPRRQRR